LEVLAAWRNPVAVITKNALVTRDSDLFAELAQVNAVAVFVSVTTLDPRLARLMEPRASTPIRRLEAINNLTQVGVPVGVMVAPIIPGLTDHEMPAILRAAARAGAQFAGHTIVRLPYGVSTLFTQWLETHYPERKNKVLNRIRAIRRGKLNDSRWHTRMRGQGIFAESIHALFTIACRKAGLSSSGPQLSSEAFRQPGADAQLSLFPR
jgi:DNA repair photolyase